MSLNKAFKEIGRINTNRSAFDLSHSNTTTANMGYLYPVLNLFAMPGDKFTIDIVSLLRALPMVYPAYVDIIAQYDIFFIPSRLLDDNFEEFITGGEDNNYNQPMPKFTLDLLPEVNASIMSSDNVFRRLGLVPNIFLNLGDSLSSDFANTPYTQRASCYPLRAYYFIWNEYYRDQNLQNKIDFKNITTVNDIASLSEDTGLFNIDFSDFYGGCKVAWQKDYFTSALPFQQRGTSPSIPFEATIDTSNLAIGDKFALITNNNLPVSDKVISSNSLISTTGNKPSSFSDIGVTPFLTALQKNSGSETNYYASSNQDTKDFLSSLSVNISDSFNIAELRAAFQVQKWMERNARAGVRYTEFLDSHYNVSPSDSRLDRPEYIGGCKFPLVISDVLQTSSSTQNEPLGSYAGRGISAGYEDAVDYFVEEFGYIICLLHIRPKTAYFQGINRQLTYNDRYEYSFPEFMHLSEQGIFNSWCWAPLKVAWLCTPFRYVCTLIDAHEPAG